jgi:hypothetical protein
MSRLDCAGGTSRPSWGCLPKLANGQYQALAGGVDTEALDADRHEPARHGQVPGPEVDQQNVSGSAVEMPDEGAEPVLGEGSA